MMVKDSEETLRQSMEEVKNPSASYVDAGDKDTENASNASEPKDDAEQPKEKVSETEVKTTGSDDDESTDSVQNRYRSLDSNLLPFPEKLMALLDGADVNDAMWWLPDGDAFCLIPVIFAERVLDKYFQGTKFESFTRKLNRWGFKRVAGQKVPPNTIAYYNRNFIRGKPKLLKNMNGGKTKFVSAREKRMKTQLKRERDREKAIMMSSPQQAMFGDQMNEGSLSNNTRLFGNNDSFASSTLPQSGNIPLQSILGQRQLLFNQAGDLRLAEQLMTTEYALAAQKQREELQMRLLRNAGVQDSVTQSFWLRNGLGLSGNSVQGAPLFLDMGALTGGLGSSLGSNPLSLQAQLLAQQRLLSSQIPNDLAANMKKKIDEDQKLKAAKFSPPRLTQAPVNASQIDPQVLQLYLLEQQRKRGMP